MFTISNVKFKNPMNLTFTAPKTVSRLTISQSKYGNGLVFSDVTVEGK